MCQAIRMPKSTQVLSKADYQVSHMSHLVFEDLCTFLFFILTGTYLQMSSMLTVGIIGGSNL